MQLVVLLSCECLGRVLCSLRDHRARCFTAKGLWEHPQEGLNVCCEKVSSHFSTPPPPTATAVDLEARHLEDIRLSMRVASSVRRVTADVTASWPRLRRWLRTGSQARWIPRINDLKTASEVLRAHEQHACAMQPFDISACWHRLGKLVQLRSAGQKQWLVNELRRRPALLEPLLRTTRRGLPRFASRPTANTAHGLAGIVQTTGFAGDPAIWEELASRAVTIIDEFNAQELTNTLWAYAKTGHASPALFDAAAVAALQHMRELSPHHLAILPWSFAKMDHAAPLLFDEIAELAIPQLGRFPPQGIANLLWAFAKAGHASPALFDAAKAVVAAQLHEFTPQGLANLVWAYASASHPSLDLFDAVAAVAIHKLPQFSPQGLANTVWAYGSVGHPSLALLDAVADRVLHRVDDFNMQNLANTAWAYASLGHTPPAMFDAMAAAALSRLPEPEQNPLHLAIIAWAYAAADAPAEHLFGGPHFVNACVALEGRYTDDHLCQLHQWQLWLDESSERASWPRLPQALSEACSAAFSRPEHDGNPSRRQRQVAAAFVELGLEIQEEVRTPQGYSLDVVVQFGKEVIAVEVDGPSHFVTKDRWPTGATRLKRRQLRNSGWLLLQVPYYEWMEFDGQPEGGRDYLMRGLQAVVETRSQQTVDVAETEPL